MGNPVNTKTPAEIEQELWDAFDDATKDAKGQALNRNATDILNAEPYKTYQKNLLARIAAGDWTPANAKIVTKCVKKAGKGARILADEDQNANCTLKHFRIACKFSEAAWRIDSTGAAGIIC